MPTNDITYTGLIALRDKLDAKHAELKRELDVVTRQLESVSVTLELLDDVSVEHSGGADTASEVNYSVGLPNRASAVDIAGLQGLTQLEALKKIAQHSGGKLYTTAAKQIMLRAGLISNPKNANNIIFAVIQRSGTFERLDRGLYRLINKPIRPARPSQNELLELN